jgi:HK97 family phage major capsid protein
VAVADKPTLTPPELRRKKAEVDGRLKAKDEENSRLLMEYSNEGRTVTEEEWGRADGLTAEILNLRRLSTALGTQLASAERWANVDETLNGDGAHEDGSGRLDRSDPMLPHNDDRNTRRGVHGYSLLKTWRSKIDPVKYKLDGLELEVHQEMSKRRLECKLPAAQGFMIPLDLPIDRRASYRFANRSGLKTAFMRYEEAVAAGRMGVEGRASGTFDTTAGGGAIPTILDTTIIEILRARMVTFGLGARVMTDMQGLFAIPRQATATTFYMVAQGTSVTATNQTIDQVPFSPHTGGVQTTYTRQLLEQINVDAEMFVREDQAAVVARGVETAALNGQGNSGYPLGILNNSQIAVYALGVNGAAPTWTQLVSMETYPAYFNADVGNLAYITDALVRGTLKTTLKISGSSFPIYLWNTEAPDFPVNGYPCGITNLLPQNIQKGTGTNLHSMIYGNWQDLVYAFWSGMDTIVDPYTQAANGGVVITTLQDFDVNQRHYQSFANCVDIVSGITAPLI